MPLHFPGQKENEHIQFLVRKHWIIYVKVFLFLIMMVGIPLGIYALIPSETDFSQTTEALLRLVFLLYLNGLLLVGFIRWMEEESDLLIVTNERILSIEQVSFMHRTISETALFQVQDVKHVCKGVLSTLLGFGSLEVQTAAEKIVFRIKDVVRPYDMARRIMDLCSVARTSLQNRTVEQPRP